MLGLILYSLQMPAEMTCSFPVKFVFVKTAFEPVKRLIGAQATTFADVKAVIIMAHQQLVADVNPDELCPPNKRFFCTMDLYGTVLACFEATDNNHDSFVPPSSFYDMIPFYKNDLGFIMELKTPSSFKTTELLWEGIHYSLLHSTSLIPYPRFTKIIIGRYKDKVGMKIPEWMISEEMKQTEHYRIMDDLRRDEANGALSDVCEASVLMVDKADELILQDTLQVSLAEHKSRQEQEARENVALVEKHLASKEIKKMVEGQEHVVDDSLIPRNDEHNIPGTRLEPRSDKESPEVGITDVIVHVNVYDEEEDEDKITDEVYELKRKEKGKNVVESRITQFPTPIRSPRIHTDLVSLDTKKLQELMELHGRYGYLFEHLRAKFMPRKSFVTLADHLHKAIADSLPTMVDKHIKELVEKQVHKQVRNQVPVYVAEGLILERQKTKEEMEKMIAKAILQERGNIQAQISSQIQQAIVNDILSQVDVSVRSYMSRHILHVHPVQPQTTSVPEQQYQLYLLMKDDPKWQQQDIAIWLALHMKFEKLQLPQTTCKTLAVRPRDQHDPHDDAHPEGEKSAKREKTSEYETYVFGEISSRQDNEQEQGPSTSGNQEQADDYDFWTDSYASDDDEIPTKQVSQDIMEEMKNFLKSNIVWESHKEILVSPHPRKTTPLVLGCRRDLEAPALSLINQDLLYLKKGNSGPKKIVISLQKFPVVVFNDDDIEERTSGWVNKCVKKFNSYARYGHEHKFITEIIARRANDCSVSITEPDFKNLNKNDIKDMYLLIMNGKVSDYVETGLLWSLSVFIRTEKHEMFSIIYEHVHGIIYKNSKKEKRVMRHSEIHKFCDATLNRVLKGLKSYNNDVRYGYNQRDLTKDEVEYLKLFEEEIEDRLKYRRQMRSDDGAAKVGVVSVVMWGGGDGVSWWPELAGISPELAGGGGWWPEATPDIYVCVARVINE
uniref:Uncharacterized protein n=1 Tax=Tanacetum cinerariifolium TaxID=118510 RepID=A0A6L2MB96_TANCI|nr:hypothetical protein [Tanacetum cinerariifolium]